MSPEGCYQYIFEKVFKLQPTEYRSRSPIWPGQVGLELEMLPVFSTNGSELPKLVPLQGPTNSLASYLREIAKKQKWKTKEDEKSGYLMLVEPGDGDNISFEPGGQLEISTHPFPCLSDAATRLSDLQEILDRELKTFGVELVQLGMNPWYGPDKVGLQMAKPRYNAMNQYFSEIGPFGKRMMRQTCTVQVNLDFGADEHILGERFLASWLMAPFVNAMFTYSAFAEGKPAKVLGQRGEAWLHIDRTRSGIPKIEQLLKNPNKSNSVQLYYDFVMDAHVIFIEDLNFEVPAKPLTFREWCTNGYKGTKPTQKDLETHLSLMFPEVRARGFLELRSVDCQSRVWQNTPAVFYVGVLYDRATCQRAIELLRPFSGELRALQEEAIKGLQHKALRETAGRLMALAQDGFSKVPSCFRTKCSVGLLEAFRERFTDQGRTPANDLVDAHVKSGNATLQVKTIRQLEDEWKNLVC